MVDRSLIDFQAGVIGDFVTHEQRERGLGERIQRAGPRVQVNRIRVMKTAQLVVELSDREGGVFRARTPE